MDFGRKSPVVDWSGHLILMRAMASFNPIRNSLLTGKAVERQLSLYVFGTGLKIGKLREVNSLNCSMIALRGHMLGPVSQWY